MPTAVVNYASPGIWKSGDLLRANVHGLNWWRCLGWAGTGDVREGHRGAAGLAAADFRLRGLGARDRQEPRAGNTPRLYYTMPRHATNHAT